ncbi:metallophosphoesterase [Elioraea sp.]|uniref:metallophosphoesterase family protein n=1 Tax=Elioraea sp. TaxID=2185103 RepID=UPI0021DDBFFD|nr:metallophosphoesterase [Elioraea sp.]GIX08970.1 MAG: phosphohydrolase [Elioraea sp.]
MFSIVQISDSHLSPRLTHFNANWDAARALLPRLSPDLIVHTGDVTLDGADAEADCAMAAERLAGLPAPLRVVPGNHDVGDPGSAAQPPTAARIARHERHFGPPLWTEDRPGWRLIGLNSQVIGTGGEADRAQRKAIAEALATLGERRIAVFLHKPMLLDAVEEGPVGYWAVPPEARDAVRPLLGHRNLRLVASGHLHLWRLASHGPATLAWAPATSFTLGTRLMPEPRGAERQLGVMRHVFRADSVETEFLRIPGAEPLVLDDMVDEIYPPAPAAAS